MSFTRIMKTAALKGLGRGILGLAASATGSPILKKNVFDAMTTGAIIGGINGTLEGFFDQLAIETNHPVAERYSLLFFCASFGTPALAWLILQSAKETGLDVGFTFETYWVGNAILGFGALSLLALSCCPVSGPVKLAAHLVFPEWYARKFDEGNSDPVTVQQNQAPNQHGFFANSRSKVANVNDEPAQLPVNQV